MLEFAKELAKEAGFLAKGYYERGVSKQYKSYESDIVTEADKEVSNFVIKKIKEKYPDHGIVSEEESEVVNPNAEYVWVVDPIDGTRNFANHIAVWCTLIGIEKNGEPFAGVVYDAINDELFYAEVGKGAYLNGVKIEVSQKHNIDFCFLYYGSGKIVKDSPYNLPEDLYKKYKRFYDNLVGDDGHWVHNYGTMLSAMHLACGRIDAFLNNSGLYHDYLAPTIIAREAGALVTDSDGTDWEKGKRDIVIANPKLNKKLLELFKQ